MSKMKIKTHENGRKSQRGLRVGSSFTSQRSLANIGDDFGCLIGRRLKQYSQRSPLPPGNLHLARSPDATIVHCLIALLTPLPAQTNNNCVRAEDKNVSGRYKMPGCDCVCSLNKRCQDRSNFTNKYRTNLLTLEFKRIAAHFLDTRFDNRYTIISHFNLFFVFWGICLVLPGEIKETSAESFACACLGRVFSSRAELWFPTVLPHQVDAAT